MQQKDVKDIKDSSFSFEINQEHSFIKDRNKTDNVHSNYNNGNIKNVKADKKSDYVNPTFNINNTAIKINIEQIIPQQQPIEIKSEIPKKDNNIKHHSIPSKQEHQSLNNNIKKDSETNINKKEINNDNSNEQIEQKQVSKIENKVIKKEIKNSPLKTDKNNTNENKIKEDINNQSKQIPIQPDINDENNNQPYHIDHNHPNKYKSMFPTELSCADCERVIDSDRKLGFLCKSITCEDGFNGTRMTLVRGDDFKREDKDKFLKLSQEFEDAQVMLLNEFHDSRDKYLSASLPEFLNNPKNIKEVTLAYNIHVLSNKHALKDIKYDEVIKQYKDKFRELNCNLITENSDIHMMSDNEMESQLIDMLKVGVE